MKECKKLLSGVVLRGVGGTYTVSCGGRIIPCRASGRLRKEAGPLAVGDRVEIEWNEQNAQNGYIVVRSPRKNNLFRPAIANIDQLMILASEAPPVTDPYLIDKVRVIALHQNMQPVILLNKSDLNDNSELCQMYGQAGFPVLRVSAASGEGLEKLRALLDGKISAFTGNSGIGKSSLLNRLNADFSLEVGEISEKISRGKHTTRQVELLPLESGGWAADTPGFSTFDVTRMDKISKDDLPVYFPEMRQYFACCRFSDCTHRKEPGCAIREAAESGEISSSRYASYQKLYEELAQLKAWEK